MSLLLSSRSKSLKYEELYIKFWGTLKNDNNLLKTAPDGQMPRKE
jgi:hypothetical protein